MRYLLAFFFFVMYAGDNLGLNISLGPGLSVKNLLLYMIVVGVALNTAVARNRKFELASVLIPFGLLILYAIITWIAVAFVLDYPDYEAGESFRALKSSLADHYLTFLVYFFGILYAKDAFWLLRAIVWIAIVGNVVTLIDAFDIPNLGLLEAGLKGGRFVGFIGQANGYGQFLVLFLPPAIALFLTEAGKVRTLAAIGVIATALALVLTGSRGSYVGLLAGAILAAFFLRRIISTRMLVRAGFITVLSFVFVLSVILIAGYSEVYLDSLSKFGGSSHMVTSGRSTIWTTAVEAMVENPLSFLTGYGFHSYESSRNFFAATHNMYLTYLYNLGSIGLFLYILIFVRILATARSIITDATAESRPYFVALVFGLFGFVVAIFFSEYHNSGYLLWAYLGVAMRMAMEVRPSAASEVGEDFERYSPQPSRHNKV